MTTTNQPGQTMQTARSLQRLYFIRAGFSILWVVLVSALAKTNTGIATVLFIIYPAWDALATYFDIQANPPAANKIPQYVNALISIATTAGVTLALQKGIPEALIVFGAWAILTGLIQLILGLRRRKQFGGQWPMMISGAQSMLAGGAFIAMAHQPNQGITTLAGYAAFGAFYFLLTAFRLSKTIKAEA
ncbi:membrane protein [Pedobacter jeongneungensis]|uniref:Membrane protein n=1 Tax=Pedobacter jeongneungensis TaxID=947309 RepID=A0ABP8BGR0_9SPHI